GDDLLEEIPRDVVGREPPLAVQRAGEAVLVFETEDPALHEGSLAEGAARGKEQTARLGTGSRAGGVTCRRRGAGGGLPGESGGTSGAPCHGRARQPRGRAR